MPGERLILNPISESTSNAPLELVGPDGSTSWGTLLMDHSYPAPSRNPVVATSSDTEGDYLAHTKYNNREISMTLRIAEPTEGASTNLAVNPRCATDTTGWTNNGMVSAARAILDQTGTPIGLQGAETAIKTVGDADADAAYLSAAVTSTNAYTFSAWVYLDANTATGVKLTARNASGTLKASSSNLTTTGTWTRLSVTVTADSTATWRFGVEQVGAGATTAYTTLALIEQASSLGPYFDGDTPGCSWSSTRYNSSSTRPASGGPRFYGIVKNVQDAVARIVKEGGTLKRVAPGAKPMVFDLIDAQVELPQGNVFLHGKRIEATLTFTAKPFWRRGEWIQSTDRVETSAATLTWTETSIDGEVPAIGKLVVDDDQGQDQRWLAWGVESRNYSSASTAGLFWEAEALTAKTSAAIATRTGASGGASNNVLRHTDLLDSYQQILSTQATGGGSHLSHVGSFRVYARVFDASTNTGTISLRLEWGQGDFRRTTQNAPASPAARNDFSIVDLGVIKIEKTTQGTQRWEGRVLGKSTVIGDDIDIDYLWLVPVEEGTGEIIVAPETSTSTATVAVYDTFKQAAGNLATKVPDYPSSTSWSGAGDATDFAVSGASNYNVTRSEISDAANTGRYAVAGSAIASSNAQVDVSFSAYPNAGSSRFGVLLRYVDTSNWLLASLDYTGFGVAQLVVRKRVAGTVTSIATSTNQGVAPNTTYTVAVSADASGNFVASLKLGSTTLKSLSGTDSVLATAATLASGKGGIYDEYTAASPAVTRTYDNFELEQYTTSDAKNDAAIFASQSCEIRNDAVVREDSGGTVWNDVSRYEGDFLQVPATGRDGRTVRFTLKAARYGPDVGADSGIDDISARLSYQPRGLTIPGSSS